MEALAVASDPQALREIAGQIRDLPADPFHRPDDESSNEAQREEFAIRLLLDAIRFGAFTDPQFLQLRYVVERRALEPRPAWRAVFREVSVWLYQHPHLIQRAGGVEVSSNIAEPFAYERIAAAVEASASSLEARLQPAAG